MTQITIPVKPNYVWSRTFSMTQTQGGPPVDLTGITAWGFVVRLNDFDTTEPALISVSNTANSQGQVTVPTPTNGQVTVTLTPAATALLNGATAGQFVLFSNPGTSTQSDWADGELSVQQVPIP